MFFNLTDYMKNEIMKCITFNIQAFMDKWNDLSICPSATIYPKMIVPKLFKIILKL